MTYRSLVERNSWVMVSEVGVMITARLHLMRAWRDDLRAAIGQPSVFHARQRLAFRSARPTAERTGNDSSR